MTRTRLRRKPIHITISMLAKTLGTTSRALRYYETIGMLEPLRDSGRRRVYGPKCRNRARVIVALRSIGVPIASIKTAMMDEGWDWEALALLLEQHLALANSRVSEIQELLEMAQEAVQAPTGNTVEGRAYAHRLFNADQSA